MPLTDRQKKSLNQAILEYFRDSGYKEAFDAFQMECKEEPPEQPMKMLESKWTAVVRLTKRVHELQVLLEEKEKDLKEALPFQYGHQLQNKGTFADTLPNAEKHTMKGHRKAVNSARFHPNTSWVASGSDDCTVGVWDFEDGKLVKMLKGHTEPVTDVCFNSNGTLLASCGLDSSIRVWNLEDEFRCIKTLHGHDHTVSAIAFLRGEQTLLSASRDGTVRKWEVESGYNTDTVDAHNGEWVKALAVSIDGNFFATTSVDQSVKLWDTQTMREVALLRGHSHVVQCVTFSNLAADEVISGRALRDDEEKLPRFLASAGRDKKIIIWNIKMRAAEYELQGHANWVRGLVFHPCGKYLISCADDKTIRVWDLKRKRAVTVVEDAHSGFVSSVDWNVTRELLMSSGNSRDIKIWHHTRDKRGAGTKDEDDF